MTASQVGNGSQLHTDVASTSGAVVDRRGSVRLDPSLFILACRINTAIPVLRLYAAFRALDPDGSGAFPRHRPYHQLHQFGIHMPKGSYNRLIRDGVTLGVWTLEGRDMLRLVSQRRLWGVLHEQAAPAIDATVCDFDLHRAVLPFRKVVYIDPSGSVADFAARCYAAYLSLGQGGQRTVSRAFLCALFNQTVPTLTDWEQRASITVRHNYEQTANETVQGQWALDRLDGEHTGPILAHGDTHARQMVNTYIPTEPVNSRSGQQRKLRSDASSTLSVQERGNGLPVRKRYYTGNTAFKRMHSAARRDGRQDRPHITRKGFIGEWGRHGMYEVFDDDIGFQMTELPARRSLADTMLQAATRHFEGETQGCTKTLPIDEVTPVYAHEHAYTPAIGITSDDFLDSPGPTGRADNTQNQKSSFAASAAPPVGKPDRIGNARAYVVAKGLTAYVRLLGSYRRWTSPDAMVAAVELAEDIMLAVKNDVPLPANPLQLRAAIQRHDGPIQKGLF